MRSKNTPPCCEPDFDRIFDEREAESDLRGWLRNGLPDSTAELIGALRAQGVDGSAPISSAVESGRPFRSHPRRSLSASRSSKMRSKSGSQHGGVFLLRITR